MPLLGPTDQLPGCPRRVVVAGNSGSGKTALARQIAEVPQIPHVEIDALYHAPQWTPRPNFVADVAALVALPAWVDESGTTASFGRCSPMPQKSSCGST